MLVSPTTPTTAFPLGEQLDDPLAMYLADLCTIPSNLAGNAAMSLPVGLAPEDGLPVGLQVMAPAMADDRLYRVGGALEAALADRWGHLLIEEAPALVRTSRNGGSAVNNIKTAITFVGTVMAGRTAISRLQHAREDGDRLELLDALLNAVVLVTGTIVIIRRLRRGEDEL